MLTGMKVKSKTYTRYDWYDIQAKICELMNISEERFRDYYDNGSHFYKWCDARGYGKTDPEGKTRGSSNIWYKEYNEAPDGYTVCPPYVDLWHYALVTVIPEDMSNDTTVTMFQYDEEELEGDEPQYYTDFIQAYNKILKSVDPNDDGIEVHFSW